MQNHHKPPRPPPLSVSLQSPSPQTQAQPKPIPKPKPKPNSNSTSNSDESPHSPLRFDSPILSDDYDHDKINADAGAIISVEKFFSPMNSPFPETSPKENATTPDNFSSPLHQIIHFNRREDPPPQSGVVYGGERKERSGVRFGGVEEMNGRRKGGEKTIEKVNLGLRVLEIVFCLISFSVMAADKTQGWSGDSFDRYKEYRFCLSVNVLGFLYAAFQAYDSGNHLATGKHVINHHLRYQFDFIMDQIISYLLISASSAAASRVDDWQSNWGKDEFTEKASASVSMAFLAFLGFAMTSLISGYNLCNRDLS